MVQMGKMSLGKGEVDVQLSLRAEVYALNPQALLHLSGATLRSHFFALRHLICGGYIDSVSQSGMEVLRHCL